MLTQNPSQNGLLANHDPGDERLGQTPVEPAALPADAGRAFPKLTKQQAAALALDAGQLTAKQAVPWIQANCNLDLSPATFNAYKSALKKNTQKDENLEPPAERLPQADQELLEALQTVKGLMKRFGAAIVKGFVDLLDS